MSEQTPRPDLDDPQRYVEVDPQGARERLFDLAQQCRSAWEVVMRWSPPALPFPPAAVLIVGMGGSAIGGDLLAALARPLAKIPVIVQRDYGLPAFAGPHTLIIASSYSGNTEETLSAATAAQERGAPLIAVTTGGELARRAREGNSGLLTFTYPAQPREALGYSLMLLLGTLVRLDLLPDPSPAVMAAADTLEALQEELAPTVPLARNEAKELARWLYGHMPLVCGAGLLAPVARRWRTQFNEVSKSWACFDQLPEMDHNLVAGTAHPAGFAAQVRAVFLSLGRDHTRSRRLEVTRRILEEAGTPCRTVAARGAVSLAQMLGSILMGDATSYYLAMLYRADPTPIPAIAALKEALADTET